MTNPLLTKGFRALVAIAGYLVLKHGTGGVTLATAPTDALVGAAGSMGAPQGGMVDIDMTGWSEVRLGGDVSAGDPLTVNGASKAVKAVPTASTVVRTIGFAMSDGAADDIISYQIAPGILTKPSA
ncbi:hypothetical protein P7F60_06280 [Rhizobium sp. YJ-22]|uniref:hypothetical protein n=1 Tax=Rhizobium sp. YJ-22 TaxID=3037556 RepID=UPI002412BE01|nr:hypothetical protein [Rhizobium sp. YJ-22]MDG3575983.1 hypothetical protein [Rhizobium sp. YJ-22]